MLGEMAALNPESPIPLYHQLAELLQEGIRRGEYPVGSRIPSEPELARVHGIGRPTVRQATDLLIRRRQLERRRGSGTFVVEPPSRVDLFSLAGTMASFERGGVAARSSLIQRPKLRRIAEQDDNPFSGREAYFLSRLSKVHGKPVLLEEFYLDPEHFRGLGKLSLAGRSLAHVAEEHFRMKAQSADQRFRVERCDASRAELLGVSGRDPILLVEREIHFVHARSAIYAELRCRTDELVFSQTLTATP